MKLKGRATPSAYMPRTIACRLAQLLMMKRACCGSRKAIVHRSLWTIAFLLPQQALFIMSSWASLHAMVRGMYADGVARPFSFISADQAPNVFAAVVYTVAIFTF